MARTSLSVLLYLHGSVNDLAAKAGISASFLSAVKNGLVPASDETLRAIAKAAGLEQRDVEAAYIDSRREYLKAALQDLEKRQRRLRRPA